MDPDKTLQEIREIYASSGPDDFERMLELVIALDAWVQKGGYLPKEWQGNFEETPNEKSTTAE